MIILINLFKRDLRKPHLCLGLSKAPNDHYLDTSFPLIALPSLSTEPLNGIHDCALWPRHYLEALCPWPRLAVALYFCVRVKAEKKLLQDCEDCYKQDH